MKVLLNSELYMLFHSFGIVKAQMKCKKLLQDMLEETGKTEEEVVLKWIIH